MIQIQDIDTDIDHTAMSFSQEAEDFSEDYWIDVNVGTLLRIMAARRLGNVYGEVYFALFHKTAIEWVNMPLFAVRIMHDEIDDFLNERTLYYHDILGEGWFDGHRDELGWVQGLLSRFIIKVKKDYEALNVYQKLLSHLRTYYAMKVLETVYTETGTVCHGVKEIETMIGGKVNIFNQLPLAKKNFKYRIACEFYNGKPVCSKAVSCMETGRYLYSIELPADYGL